MPLAIPGLILLLAGQTWFAGAATVGWILIGASVLITVIQLGILAIAAWKF